MLDILIIGNTEDLHIDAVLKYTLPSLSVTRFDVDRFPRDHRLTIDESASNPRLFLEQERQEIDISQPGIVWFRRLGKVGLAGAVPDKYRQFCLGEAEMALEGMLSLIKPYAWINEYWATRQATNKPYQYAVARQAGLHIPNTLITNSPDTTVNWIRNIPAVIAKSLHAPLLTRDESEDGRTFAFTRLLTPQDRTCLSDVATTPCQFQPNIDKAYELRVTTIGDQHVTVRIDADRDTEGKDDWRAAAEKCTYSYGNLPDEAATALTRLMQMLGINYAASDFIVTPAGETVFLEANPHGAWLWLDEVLPDLGIAERFAKYLARVALNARRGVGHATAQ